MKSLIYALNLDLKVSWDEKEQFYIITSRKGTLFFGNREECRIFIKNHTIPFLVTNDEF